MLYFSKNKLSNKTNEASSLNRQLDLALNDANLKEQQLKDKLNSKVAQQFNNLILFG